MGFLASYAHAWIPEPNTGCFLWCGSCAKAGYPTLSNKLYPHYGHHAAYDEKHGRDAHVGLTVRHSCDTRPCVNPDHLIGGTQQDNVDDMWRRGRVALGEALNAGILTRHDVVNIRNRYAAGERVSSISKSIGFNYVTVFDVAKNRTWRV